MASRRPGLEERRRLERAARLDKFDKAIRKHEARLQKYQEQLRRYEARLAKLGLDAHEVERALACLELEERARHPRELDTWRSDESGAHIARPETIPVLRDLIETSFADLLLWADEQALGADEQELEALRPFWRWR